MMNSKGFIDGLADDGFDAETFRDFLKAKFGGVWSDFSHDEGGWDGFQDVRLMGVSKGPEPLAVVTACLKDGQTLTARSSRLRQFRLAKSLLSRYFLNPPVSLDGTSILQGLFLFHDGGRDFRLSLVTGRPAGKKIDWGSFKRQSFFVEAGHGNATFRNRMGMSFGSLEDLRTAFSVEALTKEFYTKLFGWFERALADKRVEYPAGPASATDSQSKKAENLIRLITRLMFVWFMKQKGLVPDSLFDEHSLASVLQPGFAPLSPSQSDYYNAILQNLFFATLNAPIPDRAFVKGFIPSRGNPDHGIKQLYRYLPMFAFGEGPEAEKQAMALFASIPYLNGGLFECLDTFADNGAPSDKQIYIDGFAAHERTTSGTLKRAHVPNRFFFDPADDSPGLVNLLKRYNFTVDENEPGDEDVALDPEMLGKVFENLLAAVNPETQEQARKMTGSFYTPREIVSYMVDESLKAYLAQRCGQDRKPDIEKLFERQEPEDEARLRQDFDSRGLTAPFAEALSSVRVLDPACGSGAFPVGMLSRIVSLLEKLGKVSPDNWKQVYDTKKSVMESCIFGCDIQLMAAQISKLRFFISLICDARRSGSASDNYGIAPLPNLEMKFVACDSLISLSPEMRQFLASLFPAGPASGTLLGDNELLGKLRELNGIRERYYSCHDKTEKVKLVKQDGALRKEINALLRENALKPDERKIAEWQKGIDSLKKDFEKVKGADIQQANVQPDLFQGTPPVQGQLFDANAEKRETIRARISQLEVEIQNEKNKPLRCRSAIERDCDQMTAWNPYSPMSVASFFDPQWMFGLPSGFDIVIGNPPYFVLHDSFSLKPIYEQAYAPLKSGRTNIYQLFLGLGEKLLASRGNMVFIHPKTLLADAYLCATRQYLLKQFKSFTIVNIVDRQHTFESVLQSVILSQWDKGGDGQCRLFEVFSKNDFEAVRYNICSRADCLVNGDTIVVSNRKIAYDILSKALKGKSIPMNFVTGSLEWNKYKSVLNGVASEDATRLVYGENIQRYCFQESRRRACYSFLHGKSFPTLTQPAILTQRTTAVEQDRRIIATLVLPEDHGMPLAAENCVNVFVIPELALGKYILGVISSRVIDFCFRLLNSNTHVSSRELNALPIPAAPPQSEKTIVKLVDQILAAKAANTEADVSKLEAEIDRLVYQLYGLTEEEIAVVEGTGKESGAGEKKPAARKPRDKARQKSDIDPALYDPALDGKYED